MTDLWCAAKDAIRLPSPVVVLRRLAGFAGLLSRALGQTDMSSSAAQLMPTSFSAVTAPSPAIILPPSMTSRSSAGVASCRARPGFAILLIEIRIDLRHSAVPRLEPRWRAARRPLGGQYRRGPPRHRSRGQRHVIRKPQPAPVASLARRAAADSAGTAARAASAGR